jgi:hypothetical protein
VSKVKVTGAFTTISLSDQMLKNACPYYIDFNNFTFEAHYCGGGVFKSCSGSFSFKVSMSKVKITLIFATKNM